MKHQMDKQVSHYFGLNMIDFPIKESAHIVHGNALTIDWEDVVTKDKLDYIVGNPPFVGTNYLTDEQRRDMTEIYKNAKQRGKLDYVTAWYIKAVEFMNHTNIKTAFVSTNSVSQGEHVSVFWKHIFDNYNIYINFAYRTFVWSNEAKGKAAVHCVIIGFSYTENTSQKFIIDGEERLVVNNISPYLIDAPTIIVEKHTKPLCDVPQVVRGCQASDDGNFMFTESEYLEFIKAEPAAKPFIKRFMMGREFLNNITRYCLWLVDCPPSELKKMPLVLERVKKVSEFRLTSKNANTREKADTPTMFDQFRPPSKTYIALPKVSSERRKYVPMGFMTDEVIPGDKVFTVPDGTLYHFGILMSNVHNAWMRTVAGRMKSDYSYSTQIVYNAFPWPEPTPDQHARIETAAQLVLDARENYPDSSLADLYDPLSMPPNLLKAHKKLDTEVCKAYGIIWKKEEDCVADLMKMYVKLVGN